jgi:hypothetical protein
MTDNKKEITTTETDSESTVERMVMPDVTDLRKAAKCVFLATEEDVAHDLSDKMNKAANTIEELQDFAMWMTGCGYDFCQHEYFCKQRDRLLTA